jgi:prolipoprotein diacylglyceryltransferase
MNFPVYIFGIHPHLLFESLSYFIGFRVYQYTRNKEKLPTDTSLWIVVGAIFGAAFGSKFVYWLEDPIKTIHHWNNIIYLLEGKTIVGGLLGGLIGVEIAKKIVGWKESTGDDFVFPLAIGMMIGRVGCFLTGLSDHTYGIETNWITGVDFGDGVRRHPTQLYEIAFLLLLVIMLTIFKKQKKMENGSLFKLYMIGYLTFRFLIDFIKPTPHPYFHLNNIQIACIAGIIYYVIVILRKNKKVPFKGENYA